MVMEVNSQMVLKTLGPTKKMNKNSEALIFSIMGILCIYLENAFLSSIR